MGPHPNCHKSKSKNLPYSILSQAKMRTSSTFSKVPLVINLFPMAKGRGRNRVGSEPFLWLESRQACHSVQASSPLSSSRYSLSLKHLLLFSSNTFLIPLLLPFSSFTADSLFLTPLCLPVNITCVTFAHLLIWCNLFSLSLSQSSSLNSNLNFFGNWSHDDDDNDVEK